MANEGDRIRVQFTETEALAQQLLDDLEKRIEQERAIGNELEVARLQAKKAGIGGAQQYVRQTPEIEQDTEALARENITRQQGLDIELKTLDVLRQQVAERMALDEASAAQRVGVTAAPGTRFGGGFGQLAGQQVMAEEAAAAQAARMEEQRITQELERQAALREQTFSRAQQIGFAAGAGGQRVQNRAPIIQGPQGGDAEAIGGSYSADERALARYNLALGEYQGFATRAGQSSEMLTADLTRLGMVEAEASNEMRRHGALTTEWLQALARGETTVSEFGYQLGATVGKVAGWTAATGVSFAAIGGIAEFGKGAIDSANGVQQLKRTIDSLDTQKASGQFRQLSQETDVSIKQASDAVFAFSRTFHNQDDAVNAARLGLSAYQLDNVQLSDSVKMATALTQQYGLSGQQLAGVYDMLAAAQREYNARISDMIPLLQKSSGAVKNAGGDLNELIQLGAVATRVTQLSGTQVGTAFYRAAATFTPKDAGALVTQFHLGADINPMTGQGNFTKLLADAIKESANLSDPQRTQLSKDIFGPQYGGRFGALFSPESAQLLDKVTGGGPQALTPEATRGSMQKELGVQLQQTRKELDQFVFGLQRLGSALASTGALAPLGLALHGIVDSLDALTALVNLFDTLPGPVKEVVSLMVEMRLAMLFFSRTRIGSSTPGITSIPGFRPSEATLARGELSRGTRQALQQIEQDIGQTTASMLTTGAKTVELEQQRKALIADAGGEEAMTVEQLEKSNALSAQIAALKADQLNLEREQVAQDAARAELNSQMVGLTATTRRLRMSDEDVLALKNRTGAGSAGEEAAGASARVEQAAAQEAMGLGLASRAAMGAEGAVGGLLERAGGFLAALDPLTVGLLALPFVYGAVKTAIDHQAIAARAMAQAADGPVNSAQDLRAQAQRLQDAGRKQTQSPGLLETPLYGYEKLANLFGIGTSPLAGLDSQERGQELSGLATFYQAAAKKFDEDAKTMLQAKDGRAKVAEVAAHMKATMAELLGSSGLPSNEVNKIYEGFSKSLQSELESAVVNLKSDPKKSGNQDFSMYAQLSPKTIQQHLQALDDVSKVYGTNNDSLRGAALGYAALANAYRNSTDDTTLQAMAQAQQNFINAVNKNVQDLMHSATLATTDRGQMTDLTSAINLLNTERNQVESSFRQAVAYAEKNHEGMGAVKKLQDAEAQMLSQLGDLHKQVIDAALQLIKSEGDVVTSEIQGISPEADIQRAESEVKSLEQQLSFAQSHGADAQQINDLLTQLNNQKTAVLKQIVDNNRNVLEATGQLQTSQITGISPIDDINRAKTQVDAARQVLAFDQAHGAGEHQILQDQAGLNDSVRNLNQALQQRSQQIEQDAQAFIQAEAAYSESQTTDPVKAAQEALKADIATLATIRPQDYKTYQEYQTAVLQQKAKVGEDTKSLRQSIVDQDMSTLQFELQTQRITDQQYVDGLQQLLKMKKLSLKDRQDIETQIFDTLHQTAVDLNVGNIKMPTAYEIRSAIARANAGRGGPTNENGTVVSANTTNHVTMHVYVDSKKDPHLKAVSDAVHKGLTQVSGQAQAAGIL